MDLLKKGQKKTQHHALSTRNGKHFMRFGCLFTSASFWKLIFLSQCKLQKLEFLKMVTSPTTDLA